MPPQPRPGMRPVAMSPLPDRVPNAEIATAHAEKFLNYLLDPNKGHGKERLLAAIGYHTGNWEELRDKLLDALPSAEARARSRRDRIPSRRSSTAPGLTFRSRR